ncbi:MAG: class II aldolase/adducin family protein [Caldimicrobium sp.]|nr:class II aldolase/adducin family protein [Caldimicrobium sp.]MCX7614107.1 class II aldolase/adducin family protein [Caldimicrobium sp.]MDW8183000.1 class II aldolase/adducin family protein [Caldimicrobium sp.]
MSELLEELLFWTKFLAEKNLIVGSEGNLSVQVDRGFFITPSGRIKETLTKKDLAFYSWDDGFVIGTPSSEWGLHAKVYQKNPEAKAVVHSHPPYVLVLEKLEFSFKEFAHPEALSLIDKIAKLPFFPPGSSKLWDFASNLCVNNSIVVLSKHGVLSWGRTLEEAVNLTLLLEKLCKLEYLAIRGGGP